MVASHFIPLSYRLADTIIAVSEGVREQLICISPSCERKTRVLPTPVLTDELRVLAEGQIDHPWFDDSSIPVVVSAGRLKPHKGMLDLIRAFRRVRDSTKTRLLILGEGPDRSRLESEIVRLDLKDEVSLPGFSPNPFPFMKRAAVFVLASHYEGLPNVLIQALGLGTPVVATDCKSGPAEILEGGRWGTLVSLGSVDGLADAIRESLTLPRPIEAQKNVWSRFGAEQAAQAYLAAAGLDTSATA
jgi:glycosyltransferase involved in cell wall biosynthesis